MMQRALSVLIFVLIPTASQAAPPIEGEPTTLAAMVRTARAGAAATLAAGVAAVILAMHRRGSKADE
jgi:hypothetical protein